MKSKNNSKKKISAKEIKKLKIKIPKKEEPEIKKEESLEEHVEDSELIEDNEFHEFLNSPLTSSVSAPVLEKIKVEEETDLESNIISTPLARTTPETNVMSYSPNQNYMGSNYNETGKGYTQTESISPVLERTRVSDNISRKELLNWQDVQAREHSFVENQERINISNVEERRDLPFERTEKKYKEFRR